MGCRSVNKILFMRKLIFLLLFISPLYVLAQSTKSIIEFEAASLLSNTTYPELKRDGKAFPIFNTDSTECTLLLSTPTTLTALQLDNQLQELNSIETELPDEKRLTKLDGGLFGEKGVYYAFYSDRKKVNFSAFKIDFNDGQVYSNTFNLTLNKEKYLHSFSAGGYYYIVTVPIYSSIINVYRINSSLKSRKTSYDFSDVEFDGTNPKLFDEINEYIMKGNHRLSRISTTDPITTSATASFFKLYHDDQVVRLSLDHVIGTTTILEVELNSRLKNSYQIYAPPYVLQKGYSYTSNSVIADDVLFNFITGDDMMSIVVHDLETGDEIVEHYLEKNDDFNILNEEIHVDGLPFMGQMKTPKKFLRMIQGRKLGIAVNSNDNKNWIASFGAASLPEKEFTEQVMVTIGLEDFEDTCSPTYLAFQGYELSKVITARGLFDKTDFNHAEGPINHQPFDYIDIYKTENLNGFETMETVFKMGNNYYHGSYYTDSRKYTIVKF